MSIRILVADDHEVIRNGLVNLLKGEEVEIVAQADNAQSAVEQTLELKPDVVLMDIRMPDTEGLAALEQLQKDSPETKVVMLSTYDNPTYVARAVALGAADYILKGSSREELIKAIQTAASGEELPETSLLRTVKETMEKRREKVEDIPLTFRETQVLRHIALGLSNKEIGKSLGISVETVKEHVQSILRKIDVTDRTQAAVYAVRRKLV